MVPTLFLFERDRGAIKEVLVKKMVLEDGWLSMCMWSEQV